MDMCRNQILLLLYTLSMYSFSQNVDTNQVFRDTIKVDNAQYEKYIFCELISTQNMFRNEQSLEFEYGSIDNIWGNEAQLYLIKLSELKKQKTLLDALNLMGMYGWQVVHTYTSSEHSYVQERFVFQKKIIK